MALPISDRGAHLTASHVRDYKVTTLEAASAGFRPALARYLEEVPFPTYTPITRNLVVDSQHNLWVDQFPAPDATTIVWTIVSPHGSALGTVTVPAIVRIIAATGDKVYALERDEWGAERSFLRCCVEPDAQSSLRKLVARRGELINDLRARRPQLHFYAFCR